MIIFLIALALIFGVFNLIKGNLKVKLVSLIIFSFVMISVYFWYLFGLREKDSEVFFIENRYGKFENYSDKEIQIRLETELKEDRDNKYKMNMSVVLIGILTAILIFQSFMISNKKDSE